ncbi:MAG: glycerophosphodiester phosphodiesterase [Egibacteraceae bacterium]
MAAHRGNRLHAPENTRVALLAAYVAGADVLEFDVQLTRDGHLVVAHDPTIDRLTGETGRILDLTLAELLTKDVSQTFQPRGATRFVYYHGKRPMQIETFPDLLDLLPPGVEKLIELKHDASLHTGRREELVRGAVSALLDRDLAAEVVCYSKDPENLKLARQLAPDLRVAAFDWELDPDGQVQLLLDTGADGLVTDLDSVLGRDGQLTGFGRKLEQLHAEQGLAVGAVLYPFRDPGVFTQAEYEALHERPFVWSVSTDSMLDVAPFVRRGWTWVHEPFAGETVDTRRWAHGYAKANLFGRVFQSDGVHVEIGAYDGPLPPFPASDELERRVGDLEVRLMDADRNWPFYSGGGVGLLQGIAGDFAAEVDYTTETVTQATMLEMAVVNVDPGAHQPQPPASFRNKDTFFDPHGAPPFVGVEHDEDDGYRINWNLGTDYDSNQYGRPVGDGKTPRGGRLRLDRRGPYFAAYYRNDVDAPDWVCVGVARNDTLNPVVYLRCAGKRWRQERESNPLEFLPIVANHIVFKNLTVRRFHQKPVSNREQ